MPGVSMSTKNAVIPRWRESAAPVRVRSTQRSEYWARLVQTFCPLITQLDAVRAVAVRHGAARERREVAARARLREALAPHLGAREQARNHLCRELGRREVDHGRREHFDQRVDPRIDVVAARDRRAELRSQHRGATASADALRPSALHPAGFEQDRFHALHLRDVFVERSGWSEPRRELLVVRVEPGVELGAVVGKRSGRRRALVGE